MIKILGSAPHGMEKQRTGVQRLAPENGRVGRPPGPSSQSFRAGRGGWGGWGRRDLPGRAAAADLWPLQLPYTRILAVVNKEANAETRGWDILARNMGLVTFHPEPALDLLQQQRRPPSLCGRGQVSYPRSFHRPLTMARLTERRHRVPLSSGPLLMWGQVRPLPAQGLLEDSLHPRGAWECRERRQAVLALQNEGSSSED